MSNGKQSTSTNNLTKTQLLSVLDSMEEMVCRFLPDTTLTYVNNAYCKAFKSQRSELIGKKFLELIPAQEHSSILKKLLAINAENPILSYTHQAYTKDGRVLWQQWTDYHLEQQEGTPKEIQSIGRDITATKVAENALIESEERFRSLVTRMQLGLAVHKIILDQEGKPIDARFIDVNPGFESLIGKSREELIGSTLLEILPDLEDYWIEKAGKVALTGTPITYENYAQSLGKYLNIVIYQIRKYEFAVVFEDITERMKMLQKLRINKERLDQLAEQSRTFIWEIDQNGLYKYISPLCEKIIGYKPQDLIDKKHFFDIHPAEGKEESKKEIFRIMNDKVAVIGFENKIQCKDGNVIWVASQAMPLYDADGNYSGYQGSDRDINEKKLFQEQKEEQETLKERLSQLQRTESIGRLTGGIAHDFSNMLAIILGHSDLALNEISGNHPFYDTFTEIKHAAEKSAALTKQLLGFSKKQILVMEILDLNVTTRNIVSMLKRIIPERIKIDWKPVKRKYQIRMDESQYTQILVNLCVNARDSIADKGIITIRLDCQTINVNTDSESFADRPKRNEYIVLNVSDNGTGIDPKIKDSIFEPFFTTKSSDTGTGLGLSTVRSIVEENRGLVKVDSELGKGTTFSVFLPRFKGRVSKYTKKEEILPSLVKKTTILLVEDEQSARKVIHLILEKIGYHVLVAASPNEAIRLAKKHTVNIDLLITDVIMPEMNGFDLSDKIIPIYPQMETLFISSYPEELISKTPLQDKKINFIKKPFSLEMIKKKISNILTV